MMEQVEQNTHWFMARNVLKLAFRNDREALGFLSTYLNQHAAYSIAEKNALLRDGGQGLIDDFTLYLENLQD